MLQSANSEATQNINKENEDAGYRITSDKLRGTIHGTIKIRLASYALAALESLILCDQTRIEICVNRHLLTWHRIECKSCGHL